MQNEASKSKPKILYVEDQLDAFNLVVIHLKDNFEVIGAESPAQAKEILNTENIALILLDIALEEKFDGLQLLTEVKSDERYKNIPLITLTAYAMHGEKEKFLQEGADEYISKPFKRDILREKINSLIRQ